MPTVKSCRFPLARILSRIGAVSRPSPAGRFASLDTAPIRYSELAIREKRQDRPTLRKVDLPGQRSLVQSRTAREMGQLSRKSSQSISPRANSGLGAWLS